MIPRTAVEALPLTATLEETKKAFRSSGYSRLPVYRERLDEIVGVIFMKDVLSQSDGATPEQPFEF
ncbi:MAG: CBS domain-containing protein, partial [Pyrinomonadaceae bacterium]|nr:CBS domain-containing protein [Pyrinomonadaceae bacterium]